MSGKFSESITGVTQQQHSNSSTRSSPHMKEQDMFNRWFRLTSGNQQEIEKDLKRLSSRAYFDKSATNQPVIPDIPRNMELSEYIGTLLMVDDSDADTLSLLKRRGTEDRIHELVLSHRREFLKYKNVEETIISEIVEHFGLTLDEEDEVFLDKSFFSSKKRSFSLSNNKTNSIDICAIKDFTSDSRGASLLHRACQFNKFKLVFFLLKYGGQNAFYVLDSNMSNPLHYACSSGSIQSITVYLGTYSKYGKQLDISSMRDNFGNTPIHVAIQNSHFEICQYLIDHQPQLINLKKTGSSHSLLHQVAENFDLKGLKFLLETNANRSPSLHSQDQFKCTPFLHAIKCYSKDSLEGDVARVTKLSIDLSNNEDDSNFESLGNERKWKKLRVLSYLLKYEQMALEKQSVSKLSSSRGLLSSKGNRSYLASQVDSQKRNCLHLSCLNGGDHCVDFIRVLFLTISASELCQLLEAKDYEENTPLHLACHYGNIEVAKTLIHGFEILNEHNIVPSSFSALQQSENSPTPSTTNSGIPSTIDYSKVFFSLRNKKGETPLHAAVSALGDLNRKRNSIMVNGALLSEPTSPTSPTNSIPASSGKRKKSFVEIQLKEKKMNIISIINYLWGDSRVDINAKNNNGESVYEQLRDRTDYFEKTLRGTCSPSSRNPSPNTTTIMPSTPTSPNGNMPSNSSTYRTTSAPILIASSPNSKHSKNSYSRSFHDRTLNSSRHQIGSSFSNIQY